MVTCDWWAEKDGDVHYSLTIHAPSPVPAIETRDFPLCLPIGGAFF